MVHPHVMAGPLLKTSPTHPQSSMNAATGGNGREGDAASRIPDDAVRRRALSATAQRLHLITSTATRRSDLGCPHGKHRLRAVGRVQRRGQGRRGRGCWAGEAIALGWREICPCLLQEKRAAN